VEPAARDDGPAVGAALLSPFDSLLWDRRRARPGPVAGHPPPPGPPPGAGGQPPGISPPNRYGGSRVMRSPLQNRPGSYQLAGRLWGSRPMAWYVAATSSAQ